MNVSESFHDKKEVKTEIVKTVIPEKKDAIAMLHIEYLGNKEIIHQINLGFSESQLLELQTKINEYMIFGNTH